MDLKNAFAGFAIELRGQGLRVLQIWQNWQWRFSNP
jgi:hypothetical protein